MKKIYFFLLVCSVFISHKNYSQTNPDYRLQVAEKYLMSNEVLSQEVLKEIENSIQDQLDSIKSSKVNFIKGLLLLKSQDSMTSSPKDVFEFISKAVRDTTKYKNAEFILAELYRTGFGTQVNFDNAFHFYSKAYESGLHKASYPLGYFYMKGLGVKQDYKNAISLFQNDENKMASFWENYIYYMNFIDDKSRTAYLDTIKKLKIPFEKDVSKSLQEIALPLREFPSYEKVDDNSFVDFGKLQSIELSGSHLVLDWSKKYILNEDKVAVQIDLKKSSITAHSDKNHLQLNSKFEFDKKQKINNQYILSSIFFDNYEININNLLIERVLIKNKPFLLVEVDSESKKLDEPGPPIYILCEIKSMSYKPLPQNEVYGVYPNPFENNLNVELKVQSEVFFKIYDFNGRLRKHFVIEGNLHDTNHNLDVSDLRKGQYILETNFQGHKYSEIIIKN